MIEFGQFLLGEPPSSDITSDQWDSFVGDFGVPVLLLMLAGIALSLWWYKRSARRRMIHSPTDLFLPYTPLHKPMWVALGAAVIAAISILVGFHFRFETSEGMFQTGGRAAAWVAVSVWLVSYLTILGFSPLTPSKFRNRPKFWLRPAKKSA